MKTTSLKLWLAGLAMIGMTACDLPGGMDADEAATWIAAYAPERIGAGSPIRIELTDSVRHLYPDTPLGKILKFTPSVQGELHLAEPRMLEFVPREGALKPGREYTCRVRLAELTGIDSLRDFAFTFFVADRKTKLQVTSLRVDPSDTKCMRAEGMLTFSEPIEAALIEPTLLHCDPGGLPAHAQIESTDDPTCFRFTLTQLRRSEKETRVHISFNAEELSFDAPEPQQITIPGILEFKLLAAERHDVALPYIELEFSAPLSAEQELEGLIAIDRIDQVRIERSGTNVKVFYDAKGLPDIVLRISDLLRSNDNQLLGNEIEQHFEQEVIPPAVEIPLCGTILPDDHNLRMPFRAVNLAAVDVEVVKIYTDNVMPFLQESEMNGTDRLRRFGRLVFRQTVRLDKDPSLDLHQWQNFTVDLKDLFRQERGAIYNIRLSFRKAYSLYDRNEAADFEPVRGLTKEDKEVWDKDESYIFRRAADYNWRVYEWNERDDPSKESYYMCSSRMPEYNLVASNLGLIVKRADDDRLWTTVADIRTAAPLADIHVTAYNFQMREIGSGRTDARGFADFRTDGTPFVVTASDGRSTTYLKIHGGHELSTSRFDVGGKKIPQGIKGFVYGERGVWRPGDEVHLTLMVEDRQRALPKQHPVTMELHTPAGQLYDRQTLADHVDGIYVFHTKTAEDAPTGLWDARFKVGGQTFHHTVRIETIKPNRLKINIASPEVLHCGNLANIGIEAHWLTGPVAAGLSAKIEMILYGDPNPFERYGDYTFFDPLRTSGYDKQEVLSGQLDSLGRISKKYYLSTPESAPGMLQANLIARVVEAGGDESITSRSVRYSPYDSYVGIRLGDREFETDRDLHFPVVTLNAKGNALSERNLEYKIYRLNWSWWQEGSAYALNRYVQSTSAVIVASGTLKSTQGRAEVPFRLEYPAWGKYLIFVRDTHSGHATGGVVFIDWPDWRGHSGKSDPTAATMLSFALDKRRYEAGDAAVVYLPKAAGGRVLLSVENGSRLLSRRWVSTSADRETAYRLPVTGDMAPNFYVHAMLLQPHARTANDLPVRMYGVEGAEVIDRRTILHPQIEVADEIRPQQEFSIRIREKENKPMSYTLAIVDEGLLDITAFRTPEPWRAMNRREALGVRTWDMYDEVIGAGAGRFTPILSIGGDEALRRAAGKEKRFNPVVKFLGPFSLRGGVKTHRITLPMYVGSVRVMVVAAHEGSYGHADKTVTVRSPLMLLPTLPRALACGDRVKMPVNVFATESGIENVVVKVAVEGPVSIGGADRKTLAFAAPGEQLTDFELLCDKRKNGQATVTVTAEGGGRTVTEKIHIDVRNPLPDAITSERHSLEAGEQHAFGWMKFTDGSARLEIAAMPSIDFGGAFAFVESYAHLCTEQLLSRAMYMLYARRFLGEEEQQRAEQALPDLLRMIASRQLPGGGFVYWPGSADAQDWVTSMAGEVMAETRRQGFRIADQNFDRWKKYQQERARRYRHTAKQTVDLMQAYRLYTLVLAGEHPTAAMNKLRESTAVSRQALLRLAAAYAVQGRKDVAERLADRAEKTPPAVGNHTSFWSPLRDRAMELETCILTDNTERALRLGHRIAEDFSATGCTTQEVAFVCAAMSRLADMAGENGGHAVVYGAGEAPLEFRDLRKVRSLTIDPVRGGVSVKNCGNHSLTASLRTVRRPSPDEIIPATASGVTVEVHYTDLKGRPVSSDRLRQGEEFLADIQVRKSDENSVSMALTFAVPSGWEIWNERLFGSSERSDVDYTDIRDGSIRWYFPLECGKNIGFRVRLRAAYCGQFVLPPTICEDMYDPQCRAVTATGKAEVVK